MNYFDKQLIARSFDQAAEQYDRVAVLQREVGNRMFQRLELMRVDPVNVLDLGAATGYFSGLLAQRYEAAKIYSLDLAFGMVKKAKQSVVSVNQQYFICSDAECLPFADHSMHLIFSNFTVQWCHNIEKLLHELQRVLHPEGLLMFSTVGPHTLKELRESWKKVDHYKHINSFMEMHDWGDALMQAGLSAPVLDKENFCLKYTSVSDVLEDLRQLGSRNVAIDRKSGLTTAKQLKKMIEAYESYRDEEGNLPLSYEVIYAHAWGKNLSGVNEQVSGITHIPVEQLRRR